MNQETYLKLRAHLKNYDFTKRTSWYDLYEAFDNFDIPLPFRNFNEYCKGMGVDTVVRREGKSVFRTLMYEAHNDEYLLRLFPMLVKCEACGGKGVVEKFVSV